MEKVVTKRKLSDFRKRPKSKDLKTAEERLAAMSLICKSRTEDGHVERRFRRIQVRQKEGFNLDSEISA